VLPARPALSIAPFSLLDWVDFRAILPVMKTLISLIIAWIPGVLFAIPNSVFGPVLFSKSPLNGQDLTPQLTASGLWSGKNELPGEWQDESKVAEAEISYLLARPKFLGEEVVLLRATKRGGQLVSIDATFADAGSFFGYFDEEMPDNLSRRATLKEIEARTAKRQAEFSELYTKALDSLREQLAASGDGRPKTAKIGHTRTLRSEVQDFRAGDLTFRLLASDQRLIRVTVTRSSELPKSWLEPSIEALKPRERLGWLQETVRKDPDGSISIGDLKPIPQGYKPYCGINSLAMTARHFGLHIDEDWLAAAGGFKNTGSAQGSEILSLYPAVAAEAGFALDRSSRFEESKVHRALESGFPVIVWRRFSHDRDQLHTEFAKQYADDPAAVLPDPTQTAERESWPDDSAPLHASVLTGYHPERREFLFLESWSGRDTPRRMRAEEMAATAYLTFVFHP